MKVYLKSVSLLLFILCILNARADIIVKKYLIGNYSIEIKDHYELIHYKDAFLSGMKGEPSLPFLKVNLLLPPGQVAESIEFRGEKLTVIPGEQFIYPYQPVVPVTREPDARKPEFFMNQAVYQSNKIYPATQLGGLSTQYLYGFPIAVATFTPLVYHPRDRHVSYYQEITLIIRTREDHHVLHRKPSVNDKNLNIVRQVVQNPEMLPTFPATIIDTSDYQVLIISPPLFSSHFTGLIQNYFTRGMKAQVITTDSVAIYYQGQDLQEKIRNCIIEEYENHHIEHVLLAGDQELVPARGFYAQVQSSSVYTDDNIPSDIYYSALDGNWNTDGDNLWAEPGEEDLYPELSVGRFTVSDLPELNNIINKTIHYQNFPIVEECRKPLMVGEKLYDNPLTWGGDYLDLLIGSHDDNGYTTEGIPSWHNIQTLYDRDLPVPWTLNDLLTEINAGTSFLHHAGHTNISYMMRMYISQVTETNFSAINGISHNYIPIYSHGCYCAAFDASDCIAEKMLNLTTFSVAFVGNSRYGWFNEGSTEGPSVHLHREFVNTLYGQHQGQIGVAHTVSKINTAPWVMAPGQWEEGALRWCFYDCNVLGDPAMFIWTDIPLDLNVSHTDSLSIYDSVIMVQCDTMNSPVFGLTCIAMKENQIIGKAITDSTGQASLVLSPAGVDTGIITIIVSGYNCIPDTSYIQVLAPATISGTVYYDNVWHTPVDSAVVFLIHQSDTVAQTVTDTSGYYRFQQIPPGNYRVKVSCSHPWGGGSASDALQIIRHYVHMIQLSGIALKAANPDNNNYINTSDALAVSLRFVGTLSSFPAGDWVFEDKMLNVGFTGETILNIPGLCVGDVNKSFIPY